MAATLTNYLTPTSVRPPPNGKGAISYLIKTFKGFLDPVVLDADVNAFLASLSVDGEPWPHIVSVDSNTVVQGGDIYMTVVITYLLMDS